MQTKRFEFTAGKTEYMVQLWKGDYLNLGAGAEMGMYKYSTTIDGIKQYESISTSERLPMELSLTNNVSGQTIFSRAPSETQWWITGFNPEVAHPIVSELTACGTIDFGSNTDMYNAFKTTFSSSVWSFDDTTKRATFNW